MPCKHANRGNFRQIKRGLEKQKVYNPFLKHLYAIVNRIFVTCNEKEGLNDLTEDEKINFALGVLDGEVCIGGVHQSISNSSGSLLQEVIKWHDLLNAYNALRLVKKAEKILSDDTSPARYRFQRRVAVKQYPEVGNAQHQGGVLNWIKN